MISYKVEKKYTYKIEIELSAEDMTKVYNGLTAALSVDIGDEKKSKVIQHPKLIEQVAMAFRC